jgi:hypothetical protein
VLADLLYWVIMGEGVSRVGVSRVGGVDVFDAGFILELQFFDGLFEHGGDLFFIGYFVGTGGLFLEMS